VIHVLDNPVWISCPFKVMDNQVNQVMDKITVSHKSFHHKVRILQAVIHLKDMNNHPSSTNNSLSSIQCFRSQSASDSAQLSPALIEDVAISH
jgi:hypothetical protein